MNYFKNRKLLESNDEYFLWQSHRMSIMIIIIIIIIIVIIIIIIVVFSILILTMRLIMISIIKSYPTLFIIATVVVGIITIKITNIFDIATA